MSTPLTLIPCPYLGGEVELTVEREAHIAERHPDLLPEHRDELFATVRDPDDVRRSARFSGARLLARWFDDLRGGKHVVVVVVSDVAAPHRHWIVTAYMTTRRVGGEVEWQRD